MEAARPEEVPAEQPEASPPPASDEREGPAPEAATQAAQSAEEDDDEDEEVNDTCGFCIFMRGGGCRKAFNVRRR